MRVGLKHVSVQVDDLETAVRFYEEQRSDHFALAIDGFGALYRRALAAGVVARDEQDHAVFLPQA